VCLLQRGYRLVEEILRSSQLSVVSLVSRRSCGTDVAFVFESMSIRIDIESEGPDVVLDVAGRLTGPEIIQLLSVCEQMEGRFVLDLSKLKFADDAGVEVIRTLREGGASIRGASSFIKLLINGGTGCHSQT